MMMSTPPPRLPCKTPPPVIRRDVHSNCRGKYPRRVLDENSIDINTPYKCGDTFIKMVIRETFEGKSVCFITSSLETMNGVAPIDVDCDDEKISFVKNGMLVNIYFKDCVKC